jgi:hypothetical protein
LIHVKKIISRKRNFRSRKLRLIKAVCQHRAHIAVTPQEGVPNRTTKAVMMEKFK